jgi:hypothetical protein
MDIMLWVCAGIAVASALLALSFLPSRAGGASQQAMLAPDVAGLADDASQSGMGR